MCDYSAQAPRQRKAKLGEKLATNVIGFGNRNAVGFTEPHNRHCAVCLEPGTKIELQGIPASWLIRHNIPAGSRIQAIVTERTLSQPFDGRTIVADMLMFSKGVEVHLSRLRKLKNITATVRMFPAELPQVVPIQSEIEDQFQNESSAPVSNPTYIRINEPAF